MSATDQDIVEAFYLACKNKARAARDLGMAPSTFKDRLDRAFEMEALNNATVFTKDTPPPHAPRPSCTTNAHLDVTERILIIGDTHLGPGTHHPDYLAFCTAVRDTHRLSTHLHIGDVADWSSISYHEKEFWAVTPDQERDTIVQHVQPWAQAFPKLHITIGNHCDLPRRKLKTFGLPLAMQGPDRNYMIGGPEGWTWSKQATFHLACGVTCVMAHAFSGSWTAFGKMADTCALIQGHHHEMGGVAWSNNPNGRTFALSVGCGINADHPTFNYRRNGKKQLTDPVLGCGLIINGDARFVPMWTDKHGRWNGKVPA